MARLTKNQMGAIAEVAAQEAIKAYDKRQKKLKKERKDRNLRNTELLLKNYTKLKDLCEGLDEQEASYENTIFDMENLTLETLSTYRLRTLKMLNHVDQMLVAYEWNCRQGTLEEARRFDVLSDRYISENKRTVREICDFRNVEQGTVYRDTKLAIKDMSVLLFGLDAIDFS